VRRKKRLTWTDVPHEGQASSQIGAVIAMSEGCVAKSGGDAANQAGFFLYKDFFVWYTRVLFLAPSVSK
jgi:hypothetical protein